MKKLLTLGAVLACLSTPSEAYSASLLHKVAYHTTHWLVVIPVTIYCVIQDTTAQAVGQAVAELDDALSY